jgi:hypothetical protein
MDETTGTVGGVAPSTGCDLLTDIGNKPFVPYAADNFFHMNERLRKRCTSADTIRAETTCGGPESVRLIHAPHT